MSIGRFFLKKIFPLTHRTRRVDIEPPPKQRLFTVERTETVFTQTHRQASWNIEEKLFFGSAKVHAVNSLLRSSRPKRRIKKTQYSIQFPTRKKQTLRLNGNLKNETNLAKIYLLEIGFRVVIESKINVLCYFRFPHSSPNSLLAKSNIR